MSLPARQQRALDAIESALEARDPRLTALFTIFTRLIRGQEPTGAERLSRRGLLFPLLPVAVVMVLLTGLMITLATGSASACGTTARSAPESPPAVSCAARLSGHFPGMAK
jgi:hypothetical protein